MANPDRKNYNHADMVNRRARLVVALAIFVGVILIGSSAFGSKADDPVETSLAVIVPPTGATLPPISVLASTLASTSTSTTDNRPAITSAVPPSSTTTSPVTTTTTTTSATTTTTAPSTTTSTAPPTTATTAPPTTTSTRPEPTTTTTTKPKPTTTTTVTATTTTTTTTVPPTTTTTTTVPTNAWYPILEAAVLCQEEQSAIRWRAYDPAADWSNGWQMVIDGDNRGVFAPGTIVTANGGPAQAIEPVPVGTHKLTVSVHWERLSSGDLDQGFGSFSISATVEAAGCDS